MFSVYGAAGRVFAGGLEQLRLIRPVVSKSRVDAIGPQPDGFSQALASAQTTSSSGGHTGGSSGAMLGAYRDAARAERQPIQTVADLVSRPALTLVASMSAREAWQQLTEHQVSQAPVLGDDGRLVGLIGRWGIAPGPEVADLAAHWRQPVAQLMRTPVPAVSASASPRQAAQALLVTGLPGLPVVDEDGAVLGFLSRTDLLRGIAQDPPLDMWA